MKKIIAAGVLGLAMLAPAAFATEEGDTAFSVGLNMFTYEESGFDSASPMGLDFSYLYWGSPNVGYEFRAGFGMSEDTVDVSGVDVDLQITSYYGLYARYAFRPDAAFNPYGILGFSSVSTEAKAGGFSADDSGSDLSYGFGFDYMFTESTGLNMEYLLMYGDSNVDISTINIGLVFEF